MPEEATVKTVLQVGINSEEPQTLVSRTYLGEKDTQNHRKVYWSDGDAIAVNKIASEPLSGIADGTAKASFTFNSSLGDYPYNIIYPASIVSGNYVELPKVQTYKEGGVADNMLPMCGKAESAGEVSLYPMCAIVKVSILRAASTPDTDDIVAVRFKGRNSEQVNGIFEVSYDGHRLGNANGTGDQLEVRVVKRKSTDPSTPAVYHLVVPARNYDNGFDIIVQDANGHIMTKSKTSLASLDPGHLYAMPEFEFVPTETELGVEISSAADLVAFAQDYNNGEYAGQEDLVATLTQNISFDATSSAAFNATGGIGSPYGGSNYYKGIFNGNNKTISNLTATAPLFGGIDAGSTVKDLTLDNTCLFTFDRPTTDEKYYGAIAGYHKGIISGVIVNADVSLAAVSDVSGETGLGGLVGRMADAGKIDGCTYSGRLSIPSGFSTASNDVYIRTGGLVGISLSVNTVISGSHMQGTIDYAGVLTAPTSNSTTPYVTIGGIIGQNKGSVTNCDTACLDDDSDGAISYAATDGKTYYATIVNHTTQSHCLAEGGIVGYNYGGGSISSCINRAKIITNIVGSGANNDAIDKSARYFRIGGVAGINNASTISNSGNYGEIINSSSARLQVVGGIIGLNYGTGAEVSSCTNYSSGAISFITTGTAGLDVRSPFLGGVIGTNQSTNVSDLHNQAILTISCIENDVTNYDVDLGGVIGHNESAIDGGSSTKNITNSGKVYATFSAYGASSSGIDIGGIVGYSTASIQYAVNKGYVLFYGTSASVVLQKIYAGGIVGRMTTGSIIGCQNKTDGGANEGDVYFYFDNNATKHTDNYAGGILGYSSGGVSISNCSNSGYIHAGNGGTAKSPATLYVGGIVGYLAGESSAISGCTNSGNVYNHHRNNSYNAKNNSTYTGGIAGEVVGTSENRITISNCVVNPTTHVSSHRGWVGGVVGYAEYTNISSCSHSKSFGADVTSSYFVGGIAGWALNCNLTSCTWSGTTVDSSQLQTNGSGGIVAQMDGGMLDGCYSYVTNINKSGVAATGGALVGIALNTPTIKSCHYKATINSSASVIVASGGITEGTGAEVNVADI